MRSAVVRALQGAGILGTGSLGLGLAASDDPAGNARMAIHIPTRVLRDVYTVVATAADYKLSLRGLEPGSAERQAAVAGCHRRGAVRLRELCFSNGGIYIKLGQHIGQLDHLLPKEYVQEMRAHLLDRCPVSPWPEVRQIIKEDLGRTPEELFETFDEAPFASASLAQVHSATLPGGRRVAVKVQHSGLREASRADLLTIEYLVRGVNRVFPDFNYQWLVDEAKENLPKELDFEHEASNAARCRANFASRRSHVGPQVYVPEVLGGMTGPRVLTMEFMQGVHVTDTRGLLREGLAPQQVAKLVSEAFNEMIFIFGDVHADPHEKNLMVRMKNGRPQLILLDHGLYRQIDDNLRHEYAALWRSLILADAAGIKAHCQAMNAGDAYMLFAAMLTTRPWNQITGGPGLASTSGRGHAAGGTGGGVGGRLWGRKRGGRGGEGVHLKVPGTEKDKEMIRGYVQQFANDISNLLLRVPRPLLLLLKTNDCLRAVDAALGTPVNTFAITARYCQRALSEPSPPRGLSAWLSRAAWSDTWQRVRLEGAVVGLRALSVISALSGGGRGEGGWTETRGGPESDVGGEEGPAGPRPRPA